MSVFLIARNTWQETTEEESFPFLTAQGIPVLHGQEGGAAGGEATGPIVSGRRMQGSGPGIDSLKSNPQ